MHLIFGSSILFLGVCVICLCGPLALGKIKPNLWYGFRFKKSYESKENWRLINQYGGRVMMMWALPIVAMGVFILFYPDLDPIYQTGMLCLSVALLMVSGIQTYLFALTL